MTGGEVEWKGRIRISRADEDPAWDEFLESLEHGHYTQTSLWSRVKGSRGLSVTRVVAERGGVIEGGAQILHRPLRGLGRAGYITMGPVLSVPDSGLDHALARAIEDAAHDERIRLVVVQPPVDGSYPVGTSSGRAGLPGIGDVAPRATIVVDVSRSPDELLASMRSSTRYNTRVGSRRGIVIREGGGGDIPTFHRLVSATAERQGFRAFPESYYAEMWRVLAPHDHIRLTFAESGGEPIAGQLAIVFGRTVVNKLSVWSGQEGASRPNEALQWDTITWAHAHGMQRYDLEGIRVEAARSLLAGEALPDCFQDTVTSYKLGFGGGVVIRPAPSVVISNPVLDVAIRRLYPRLQNHRWAKRMRKQIQMGSGSPGLRGRAART